jgi:hypothetical protein
MAAGADIMTTPENPFKMAQTWLVTRNMVSSLATVLGAILANYRCDVQTMDQNSGVSKYLKTHRRIFLFCFEKYLYRYIHV